MTTRSLVSLIILPLLLLAACTKSVKRQQTDERALASEAHSFLMNFRQANARFLKKNNRHVVSASKLSDLDIRFSGPAPGWGMKNFVVEKLSKVNCAGNVPPHARGRFDLPESGRGNKQHRANNRREDAANSFHLCSVL